MGLFDFFKSKEKKEPEKPITKPNEQGEFNLSLADFSEKIHRSEVLADAWIDPEFAKEFASGPPKKKGDIIELKTHEARIILEGKVVDVTFDPEVAAKNIDGFVQKINLQLNWLTKSKNLVNEVIIRDLLPLKNENWLEENQSAISEEDFINSIHLTSIDFNKNAAFELFFDDGDLFWGHSISVSVNAKREVKEATIAG